MTIKYIPGNYPVPMLSYFTEHNESVFNSTLEVDITNSKAKFTNKYSHMWNMSAYLIYNEETLEVISCLVESIPHLVYLLRALNKPLIFNLDNEQMQILKKEFESNFIDEFICM